MADWGETFRTRLGYLVEHVPPPPPAKSWTNDLIAQEVRAVPGLDVEVTATHVSHLRAGRRDNPSAKLLGALADVFGVPTDYWFNDDTARAVEKDLELLTALRTVGAGGLRTRGDKTVDASLLAGVLDALQTYLRAGGNSGGMEGAAQE